MTMTENRELRECRPKELYRIFHSQLNDVIRRIGIARDAQSVKEDLQQLANRYKHWESITDECHSDKRIAELEEVNEVLGRNLDAITGSHETLEQRLANAIKGLEELATYTKGVSPVTAAGLRGLAQEHLTKAKGE
jgi:archaellum component FlaC